MSSFPLQAVWPRIRQRLSRPTSGAYLREIDGFRFFAIAAVFGHHISSHVARSRPDLHDGAWLRSYLDASNVGVEVFFAISGYILALPFLRALQQAGPAVSVKAYLLRRVVRLEPPYLLSLAFLLWLKWDGLKDPWSHAAASATYLHAILYKEGSPIHFVAWSLEIEVQFYVLMPLLAWTMGWLKNPFLRRGWVVLLAAACIWRQFSIHGNQFPVGLSILDYFQFFAVGVLWADVHAREPERASVVPNVLLDVPALLCWLLIPWTLMTFRPQARWLLPLLILVTFEVTMRSRWVRVFFASPVVSTVGGMCYTIYLYHWYLMKYLVIWLGGFKLDSYVTNLAFYGTISAAWVILTGSILFAAFERPFMGIRLKRNVPPAQ